MPNLNIFLHYRDYDFISIQIDGQTQANFYCSFEGLYYYAFHLSEIIWGILWLYDLRVIVGKPGLFTGKYLMYYACVAYFSAFGLSIVLYFQDVDNFTSVSATLFFPASFWEYCVILSICFPEVLKETAIFYQRWLSLNLCWRHLHLSWFF